MTPYSYAEVRQQLDDLSGAFGRGSELAALLLAMSLVEYCDQHREAIERATGVPLPLADREK